jgi:hypothetical protein
MPALLEPERLVLLAQQNPKRLAPPGLLEPRSRVKQSHLARPEPKHSATPVPREQLAMAQRCSAILLEPRPLGPPGLGPEPLAVPVPRGPLAPAQHCSLLRLEARRLGPRTSLKMQPLMQQYSPAALEPQALEPQALEPQVLEPRVLEPQVLEPQVLEPLAGKAPATGQAMFRSSPWQARPQAAQLQQPRETPARAGQLPDSLPAERLSPQAFPTPHRQRRGLGPAAATLTTPRICRASAYPSSSPSCASSSVSMAVDALVELN